MIKSNGKKKKRYLLKLIRGERHCGGGKEKKRGHWRLVACPGHILKRPPKQKKKEREKTHRDNQKPENSWETSSEVHECTKKYADEKGKLHNCGRGL